MGLEKQSQPQTLKIYFHAHNVNRILTAWKQIQINQLMTTPKYLLKFKTRALRKSRCRIRFDSMEETMILKTMISKSDVNTDVMNG